MHIARKRASVLDAKGSDVLFQERESPLIDVEKSRNGNPTARYKNVLLHSAYDPQREAERLSDAIKTKTFDCVVLLGMGLGYVVTALSKKYPFLPIFCVEYDKELCAELWKKWDHSAYFMSTLPPESPFPAAVLIDPSPEAVRESLRERGLRSPCVLQSPFANSLFPKEKIYALTKELRDYRRRAEINYNTLERFKKLWETNILKNTARYGKNFRSIEVFKNAFSGIPALLCCGGPSFYTFLPKIKQWSQQMLVFAVDTIMPVLAEHEVVPDFVVSVDPQYVNCWHLYAAQWRKQKSCRYIVDIAVHPSVLGNAPKGCDFFLGRPTIPLGSALFSGCGYSTEINTGGSVATYAWDALRFMGVHDIYTLGLDLSYPLRVSHSRGCVFAEDRMTKDSRTLPSETNLYEHFCDIPHIQCKTYDASIVESDERLLSYHKWFAMMHSLFPNVRTFTFNARSAVIPSVKWCAPASTKILPRVRPMVDDILDAERVLPHDTVQEKKFIDNARKLQTQLNDYGKAFSQLLRWEKRRGVRKSLVQKKNATKNFRSLIRSKEHAMASDVVGFFLQKDIHEVLQFSPDQKIHSPHALYAAIRNCSFHVRDSISRYFPQNALECKK